MLLTYLAGDNNLKLRELHKGCDIDFPQKGPYIECGGKKVVELGKENE